jgi:hypothetical protein
MGTVTLDANLLSTSIVQSLTWFYIPNLQILILSRVPQYARALVPDLQPSISCRFHSSLQMLSGLTIGSNCACGTYFDLPTVDDSFCSTACPGNANETCGGISGPSPRALTTWVSM